MIRRLKYHEIDFEKYTNCLENSEQRNWYAKKEVLDRLSGNWEVLVYKNYEAIMPLHLTKKIGVKFVQMPLFCQQLGVFSAKNDEKINDQFLKYLNNKFWVFNYAFNYLNTFSVKLQTRKNYIIPISTYQDLRKNYFKGRKSTVKCAQHLNYEEVSLNNNLISFIENNFKGLSKEKDYKKFEDYIQFLDKKNILKLCGAFLNNQLINLAIIIVEDSQMSLLALINNEEHKIENGPSFLIDRILRNYIHEKSFNFMGSNIRGIEIFFKSFGAVLQEYNFTENKILKKFS